MINLSGYSNSISFDSAHGEGDLAIEAAKTFHDQISRLKPRTLQQKGNAISYSAGVLRFVFNTNLLYVISEGEIKVEQRGQSLLVHYSIKFYEALAFSIIAGIAAILTNDSLTGKLIGLLLVFVILYGVNVLIAILRYRRFIRRTMAHWLAERANPFISPEQQEWIINENKCDACGSVVSQKDITCPDCGLKLR